ncbi:putative hydrolase of the HAD superfamily [Pricia antarctica]|uniref:Putative hydrolase of the HAD superfamily n=1 Tax=Pricia antarctica TaxID=641691 RepID=A0A1G7FK34_9FLAO|nr:HAD family hydrolase [Pricia antarctica]SDE76190.1 putative hydrolase of the HAD superfamily [Pricia antarctica]
MDIKVDAKTVIVFDLDDTLYNEMEYLRSAYSEIAQSVDSAQWRPLFARMYSLFRSKKDVFEFVSKTYKMDKSHLLNTYRTHVPSLQPFKGVLDTLAQIKAKKGKIGILTDGRKTTQRAKLKALDIIDRVDKIVVSEEVGSEKPDERNYRIIEEAFPDCTYLYMADNLRKDFIAPNKLGWQTLGLIDNGLNMHFDGHGYFDKSHMPQQFVTSFEEINIV